MATESVAISGGSLLVETSGEGPPILMVAGLGDDHTLFDPLVAQLRDRFTCVTYDHRGSGASSPLPANADIATLAEDGHRLIDELSLSGLIGLGCSMGGFVLQEWALRYPDDFEKVILISTSARPRRHNLAVLAHWERLYEAGQTQLLVESLALFSLAPSYWDREHQAADALLEEDELAPGFITQLRACMGHDSLERIGRLRPPAMVIGGASDLLLSVENSEELADQIPDCSLRILPTGHVPFWEAPAETGDVVAAFCGRSAGTA